MTKKRYIVEAEAKVFLSLNTLDAITELGSDKIIKEENLHFRNLEHISVMLTEEEVKFLKSKGLFPTEEGFSQNITLASNYERVLSLHHKTIKKSLDGSGVRVGVLDTGCNNFDIYNVNVVDVDAGYNFISNSEGWVDGHGHGTLVSSILKKIMAPGVELHVNKMIADSGSATETAVLGSLDYVIDEELDFINLSWTYYTSAIGDALTAVRNNGTVVCAAAGNSQTEYYTLLPASLPGVIAVNTVSESRQPYYRNIIPMPGFPDSHGIDVACGGVASEGYNRNNQYVTDWGTSLACPFFVGTLALYKQELQEIDNNKVAEYVLKRAKKTDLPEYFGNGIVSF